MNHPLPSFKKLITQLQKIPYLASKHAYKLASYVLTSKESVAEELCAAILDARKNIGRCLVCSNWTENKDTCQICLDGSRDRSIVCVVEQWYDLIAIERIGIFRGVYHVLGGALCPLDGIGPSSLTIDHLLKRLDGEVKELIFATNPTPEGEATAGYIASLVGPGKIFMSKFASGLPTGASIEFMDKVTIHQAYVGRRPY
ncbi:recombination protein RecR [Candidatus Dependentiae bacterium]|nr:recombination protein RecR [Candidatus Dependentiae bacterium]